MLPVPAADRDIAIEGDIDLWDGYQYYQVGSTNEHQLVELGRWHLPDRQADRGDPAELDCVFRAKPNTDSTGISPGHFSPWHEITVRLGMKSLPDPAVLPPGHPAAASLPAILIRD